MGRTAGSDDPCTPERCMTRRVAFWVLVGILGAALAAWLPGALSQERWITAHGIAVHLSPGDHCNSITTGLGAEYGSRDWRTVGGFYRNSNCRWTVYAGEAWTPIHWGAVSFGAVAGVATGYVLPITPAAGPTITYEGKRYGANVVYIPPYGSGGNVLWAGLKWKF